MKISYWDSANGIWKPLDDGGLGGSGSGVGVGETWEAASSMRSRTPYLAATWRPPVDLEFEIQSLDHPALEMPLGKLLEIVRSGKYVTTIEKTCSRLSSGVLCTRIRIHGVQGDEHPDFIVYAIWTRPKYLEAFLKVKVAVSADIKDSIRPFVLGWGYAAGKTPMTDEEYPVYGL